MHNFLDKTLGTFLIFVLPLLIAAFAPYWLVAISVLVIGGLWCLASVNPDPDLAWEEGDDRVDPCLILAIAGIVILILRLVS